MVCVHIYTCTYVWKVTLREVAMYLCVCVLCTCVVCIHIHMYGRLYTLREGAMNSYGRMGWGHDLNVMLLEVFERRGGNISQDTLKGTISVCRYSRCTFYVQ